jgi:hypothetical protein
MKIEDEQRMLHELLTMANLYRARGRDAQADELMGLVNSIRARLSAANLDPHVKEMLHLTDDTNDEEQSRRA